MTLLTTDPMLAKAREIIAEQKDQRLELEGMLNQVYESYDGSEALERYMERHQIRSAGVLTVTDDSTADAIAAILSPRIEGKTVVEIGGGIGLLALHMAQYAKRVYCIEADPNWSWTFAAVLLERKPKNVSYLFGSADEFIKCIWGDVALFCTHSDATGMRRVGENFAPVVIDVYGEMMPDKLRMRSGRRTFQGETGE